MKRLNIHLQPDLSPALDVKEALARLRLLGAPCITEGDDDGSYINIDYETTELVGLWTSVCEEIRAVSGMADAAIICCEGEHGWDDYLLLHHFDRTEPLDELS